MHGTVFNSKPCHAKAAYHHVFTQSRVNTRNLWPW